MTDISAARNADDDSWSERIDDACDQFETDFRNNRQPSLEHFLEQFPAQGRARLLYELIPLEMELLHEREINISLEAYKIRFPGYLETILQLENEMTSEASPPEERRLENTVVATPEPKGMRLKHFLLRRIIGQGGFGTVWTAEDTRLQRDVAVKIPRQDRFDRRHLSMFLREARAAARLRHPHIVTVHEVGEGDGDSSSYIVTELIDGPSLKKWLHGNSISVRQAATLVAMLAEALQHAHERGIIHRDLKPANVLMDQNGSPHLADFGLAKRDLNDDSLAIDGRLLGTPNYMAPEQARGEHQAVDARTDLYALGVILYELLTGHPPFRGELAWLLEQISDVPPPPPRSIKPGIPEDLEQICLKCLAKSATARYQTARELADDLHRFLNGETLRGVNIPLPKRIRKWAWRNRRTGILMTLTSCLCLAAAAGLWWWSQPVVNRKLVEFVTQPPGCEITAVAIDPATGEPNPDRIEHAHGKTPLVMPLIPGDYLIVAVLDEQRFLEVLRRVPRDVSPPLASRHLFSRTDKSGLVSFLNDIQIPRPDVTNRMAFVEGNRNWQVPRNSGGLGQGKRLSMPPFYVDFQETRIGDPSPDEATPLKAARFQNAISLAEDQGKRLPSGLELLYLHELHDLVDDAEMTELNRAGLKRITGLNELPWEWSTTTPPAFSDRPGFQSGISQLTRLIGCGVPSLESHQGSDRVRTYSMHPAAEQKTGEDIGFRFIRSVRPRTRPEDFVRTVPK